MAIKMERQIWPDIKDKQSVWWVVGHLIFNYLSNRQ